LVAELLETAMEKWISTGWRAHFPDWHTQVDSILLVTGNASGIRKTPWITSSRMIQLNMS
jgi:hypothetical protein